MVDETVEIIIGIAFGAHGAGAGSEAAEGVVGGGCGVPRRISVAGGPAQKVYCGGDGAGGVGGGSDEGVAADGVIVGDVWLKLVNFIAEEA